MEKGYSCSGGAGHEWQQLLWSILLYSEYSSLGMLPGAVQACSKRSEQKSKSLLSPRFLQRLTTT